MAFEELSPDVRLGITTELDNLQIPYAIFDHAQNVATVGDKLALLNDNADVAEALVDSRVIGPGDVNLISYIVSKTLTGTTSDGSNAFVLTTFGPSDLSLLEKKQVLTGLGIDNPSRRQAKGMLLGSRSGVDIKQFGMSQGCVGPFIPSDKVVNSGIANVVLLRPLFPEPYVRDSTVPIVDFALGQSVSLLFLYNHIYSLLNTYDPIYLSSSSRTAVIYEP